jgi:hypothetical protein
VQLLDERQRAGCRRGLAHHLEPGHALGEGAVHRGGHEVVVDDQRADHGAPICIGCRSPSGSLTVNSAPSTFSTEMLPPRRRGRAAESPHAPPSHTW